MQHGLSCRRGSPAAAMLRSSRTESPSLASVSLLQQQDAGLDWQDVSSTAVQAPFDPAWGDDVEEAGQPWPARPSTPMPSRADNSENPDDQGRGYKDGAQGQARGKAGRAGGGGGGQSKQSGSQKQTAAQLTRRILECTTWQTLQRLHAAQQHSMDFIHLSAAVTHLAKIAGPASSSSNPNRGSGAQHSQEEPQQGSSGGMQAQAGGAKSGSNSKAAGRGAGRQQAGSDSESEHRSGSSGHDPPSSPAGTWVPFLQALLQQLLGRAEQLRPREAANVAWAVARLSTLPVSHSASRAPGEGGGGAAHSAPDESAGSGTSGDVSSSSSSSGTGASAGVAGLEEVARVVRLAWSHITGMNAQELSNTLYASALLGMRPSSNVANKVQGLGRPFFMAWLACVVWPCGGGQPLPLEAGTHARNDPTI